MTFIQIFKKSGMGLVIKKDKKNKPHYSEVKGEL